ncbi:MAG: hypothetical protein ACP6IY_02140 [Promethearchaeia archaeon]
MSEKDQITLFIEAFMEKENLKGKPTFNTLLNLVRKFGMDEIIIKREYDLLKKKENYASEIMNEIGLKGKAKRLMIMKIIDNVGWDKAKIKTAILRSSIAERISHS